LSNSSDNFFSQILAAEYNSTCINYISNAMSFCYLADSFADFFADRIQQGSFLLIYLSG
jgi:hypothetical protein